MRYVCSTGGRLSEDMIRDLSVDLSDGEDLFDVRAYGSFRSTYLDPDKLDAHPTSVGKAIPDCQVMVLDEHGDECPPGVVGELVHRGATVTKGYWRDPENTAKVFRTHPRVSGGDLGLQWRLASYRDAEGFLYFVSRADEMIKTKGFRVSPTEVETEVVRHPDVIDAVAFAVPNIAVGEDVACAYTTVTGKALAGAYV